jgi:DNA-binding SARP family transcriptional activator
MAAALGLDQRERAELMTGWSAATAAAAGPAAMPPATFAAPILAPVPSAVRLLSPVAGLGPASRPAAAGPAAAALAPRLQIAVLGPLTVRRDGQLVRLGSPRQGALLGLLALGPGAGVHRDEIVDVLWGTRPPASAGTQVHGYVSRLRALLDPGMGQPGLIVTDGPRYHLAAGDEQLDLAAFRRILERADQVAAAGWPGAASVGYEQALALWRGDPLAGLDPLRQHPAAVELGRQHAEAVLRYAVAARRAGVAPRALAALRGICGREPLNEAAHAHLMLALAAAGQRAAALDLFDRLSRRLADDLGVSPGSQLARARSRLLGEPPARPEARHP